MPILTGITASNSSFIMNNKCETVVISNKAYNAIIRESFARHPVETGGILLGYILDNGLWVVMEMIPPGINGVFKTAYFEYDQDFVNYLGTSVANQYKEPLQVLGLWHRHPGSMDYFSSTDDGTNSEFASKNPYGVISGLVNIDPTFRLTMYHLNHNDGVRPHNIAYTNVEIEVGDDLIPKKFFALRYINDERSELHPTPTKTDTKDSHTHSVPESPFNKSDNEAINDSLAETNSRPDSVSAISGIAPKSHRKWIISILTTAIIIAGLFVGYIVFPSNNDTPYNNVSICKSNENKTAASDSLHSTDKEDILENIANTPYSIIKDYKYSGTFTDSDSIKKEVLLEFLLKDDIIKKAVYTNVELGGIINMAVEQINDSTINLTGKDGNNDFFIVLKPMISGDAIRLTGEAKDGNKKLDVFLSHNALTNQADSHENDSINGSN